jgi:hypothetical protein
VVYVEPEGTVVAGPGVGVGVGVWALAMALPTQKRAASKGMERLINVGG